MKDYKVLALNFIVFKDAHPVSGIGAQRHRYRHAFAL
jgi:hypothetical protein